MNKDPREVQTLFTFLGMFCVATGAGAVIGGWGGGLLGAGLLFLGLAWSYYRETKREH